MVNKFPVGALALIVLIILVGWAASLYISSAATGVPAGTSSTASALSSHDSVSSILGTKSQSATSGGWLANDPVFAGDSPSVDYPPSYGVLANFTLGLINKDRAAAGLTPVTLSGVQSGQQHADSMAYYRYFSHWDNQGYKPYMRYTLLGGTGSVSENLALNFCSTLSPDKSRQVSAQCSVQTVENAINASEWGMMNNDTACCDNGHRMNILEPIHNRVSVGVAYNSTTLYLVEDFEDDYIGSGSIQVSAGVVTFSGTILLQAQDAYGWMRSSSGAEITVYFDPLPGTISHRALALSPSCSQFSESNESLACQYQGAYNPGTPISTVFAPCPPQFVCSSTGNYTYALVWQHSSGSFHIVFSISGLESAYGNGVYTFYLWPAARAPEPITSLSVFVTGA